MTDAQRERLQAIIDDQYVYTDDRKAVAAALARIADLEGEATRLRAGRDAYRRVVLALAAPHCRANGLDPAEYVRGLVGLSH